MSSSMLQKLISAFLFFLSERSFQTDRDSALRLLLFPVAAASSETAAGVCGVYRGGPQRFLHEYLKITNKNNHILARAKHKRRTEGKEPETHSDFVWVGGRGSQEEEGEIAGVNHSHMTPLIKASFSLVFPCNGM